MAEIVNTEQARSWNGYEGRYWADNADRWNAINDAFNEPLFDAAGITAGDRVLDVGCGAGRTTLRAARRAAPGHVLGLDLSVPMLERARATAAREGIDNVAFERGDAQVRPFRPAEFDALISRYGVMFFADPVAAFGNLARALRPNGRLAFVCGTEPENNEWLHAIGGLRELLPVGELGTPGQPGMFAFADAGRVREVLSAAGFTAVRPERLELRANWGADAEDAADFLLNSGPGRHSTSQVDRETTVRARLKLIEMLREHERGGMVGLRTVAWLVTAIRPE
jgi:SAM-dependent methyltransferase